MSLRAAEIYARDGYPPARDGEPTEIEAIARLLEAGETLTGAEGAATLRRLAWPGPVLQRDANRVLDRIAESNDYGAMTGELFRKVLLEAERILRIVAGRPTP